MQTEDALMASESRLRAQYDGSPIPTYTWQRRGDDIVLVDYNKAAATITQGKVADFVERKASEMDQDRPDIQDDLARCLAEKRSFEREMDYEFVSTSETKHVAVKYAFVPPDLVLVHTEDITKRRQVEEALRTSQRFLESALDSLWTNIAVLDETGQIIAANASWRAFANENGLVWTDYGVGRNYLAVVDAASEDSVAGAQEAARGIRELISGQRDQFSLEYPCHNPSEKRWFIMRATRFHSSQGVRVVVSHENITARKQAETQLKEAAASAEQQRLARELHDSVTQSLFLAASLTQALPRVWEQNPDGARQVIADLRRLTQGALAEMRTTLLELRPAGLTRQRLGVLLRQLTDGMLARTPMEVITTLEGSRSVPDEVQITLYRIAQEALNNIVKHSQADRAIVNLRSEPEQVVLSIRDEGIGFDPNSIEPGRMGLDIIRERSQTIGAEFVLDSEPGRGTEITVTWNQNSEQ